MTPKAPRDHETAFPLQRETAPRIVYHYTNQQGLLGILRQREMWVTHATYLNDQREVMKAVDMMRDEIARRSTSEPDVRRLDILKQLLRADPAEVPLPYICSFSTNGDLLSQWRAYGGPSAGFSIGFRGGDLRRVSDAFVRCRYDNHEQRTIVGWMLDEIVEQTLRTDRAAMTSPGLTAARHLVHYAHIIKDQSFHEEHEWRAVLFGGGGVDRFREGKSLIVPYRVLDLQKVAVLQVVVGPTAHVEASRRSVELLLESTGHQQATVTISAVPFRNW